MGLEDEPLFYYTYEADMIRSACLSLLNGVAWLRASTQHVTPISFTAAGYTYGAWPLSLYKDTCCLTIRSLCLGLQHLNACRAGFTVSCKTCLDKAPLCVTGQCAFCWRGVAGRVGNGKWLGLMSRNSSISTGSIGRLCEVVDGKKVTKCFYWLSWSDIECVRK